MRKKGHKVIIQSIAIGAICLLLLISVASFYMKYLHKNITEEITTNLREVASKNAYVIQTKMNNNLDLLESFAEYIQYDDIQDAQKIVEKLSNVVEVNGYKRMGISDLDGNCYTTDGVYLNIAERDYFQQAKSGKRNVSEVLHDLIGDKGLINAYATPVYRDGNVAAVLFMVKDANEVAKNLLVTSFDGSGNSMLINALGDVVLRTSSDKSTYDNIAHLDYDDGYLKQDHEKGLGVTSFEEKDETFYMAYAKLGINKWVVVSVVPATVITSEISSFTQMAIFTWVIIIMVFMFLLIYIDLSWHRNHRKMQKVLFKDSLTGFDNFNKFKIDMEQIMGHKKNKHNGSLIEMDIEDFKMFNKIHGYETGDELLKAIMRCIHLYCGCDECCARISDDRFVIYWEEQDKAAITARINQMYSNIIVKFESESKHVGVKFHLCFGIYIMGDEDEHSIMKALDKAIYAKNHTKNTHDGYVSFYNEVMYQQVLNDKYMLERVDKAIEDEEFVVYLQPKVNVDTGDIVAAEALVRWKDPQKGLIPPNDFIPLFEKNNDLFKLDNFVISKVCKTLKKWQHANMRMITISVNISKSYMFNKGFAQHVHDILVANQLSPEYIELEITESTMLENPNDLLPVIDELKQFGFKISMDDFGSGYSSLNMLKEVPIDVIKIDQVFFRHTKDNQKKSRIIIAGLCQLINMLHIETVAEGIETKDQLKFLQRVKCHIAQGYYFYRPMPIEELEIILNEKE